MVNGLSSSLKFESDSNFSFLWPAQPPGLNYLDKIVYNFPAPIPGGSETSVERTNLGNGTLGPVRGLNLVP